MLEAALFLAIAAGGDAVRLLDGFMLGTRRGISGGVRYGASVRSRTGLGLYSICCYCCKPRSGQRDSHLAAGVLSCFHSLLSGPRRARLPGPGRQSSPLFSVVLVAVWFLGLSGLMPSIMGDRRACSRMDPNGYKFRCSRHCHTPVSSRMSADGPGLSGCDDYVPSAHKSAVNLPGNLCGKSLPNGAGADRDFSACASADTTILLGSWIYSASVVSPEAPTGAGTHDQYGRKLLSIYPHPTDDAGLALMRWCWVSNCLARRALASAGDESLMKFMADGVDRQDNLDSRKNLRNLVRSQGAEIWR